MEQIEIFFVKDFTKWLKKNHDKKDKVSLIIHKKHTGKPSPSHRELMEEAICFGWIDTILRSVDENRYTREFSRRNKNSKWSENTLGYAKRLIKEGRMNSHGLEFYKQGKNKPLHDGGIPKNPEIPKELKQAFSENKKAKDNFDKFAPSKKRMTYRWILRAKTQETRNKRINSIMKSSEEGKLMV